MPAGVYKRRKRIIFCGHCSQKTSTTGMRTLYCSRKCRDSDNHERNILLAKRWRHEHREQLNSRNREKYRLTDHKKKWSKKYEKTYFGYLVRKYRNMQSRITGIQKKKFHLYKGLELLSRDDFYKWAMDSKEYKSLFETYCDSGYSRKLAPSVNRINPCIGYVIPNMEWITHSENSAKTRHNHKLKI